MLDHETKLELLVYGVRTDLEPLRKGGAGPTDGLGFILKGSVISAPVVNDSGRYTPFRIEKSGKNYILYRNEKKEGKIDLPKAEYYSKTVDGFPAGKLVALDGYDALVSAVSRKCIYWSENKKCMFCNIQNGIKNAVVKKNPEKLAMAVKLAYEEDKSRHLTLTTGTLEGKDRGARALIEAVKAVKREVDIDVHVQIEPVNVFWIEKLYESGADTIGIHAETFDEKIRYRVVPGKPQLEEYFRAWKHSVRVFGEWNVSSWLIAGLGETRESLVNGFRKMVDMDVYPFIAPFRPPNGYSSPKLHFKKLTLIAEEIMDTAESMGIGPLKFRSGCPKCSGCSFIAELLT